MKPQLAYNSNWTLPVLIDDNGVVFYSVANTNIVLPFVTNDKYTLIDVATVPKLAAKFLFNEMVIKNLKSQVADNYSSDYLQKYFSEKKLATLEVDQVNHIITKYSEFLDVTMFSKGEWYDKMNDIKKSDISRLEKDTASIELFMDFLKQ